MGDKGSVYNYRHISILSTLSKIIEKWFVNNLMFYLDKYQLHKKQSGFRKNHSNWIGSYTYDWYLVKSYQWG